MTPIGMPFIVRLVVAFVLVNVATACHGFGGNFVRMPSQTANPNTNGPAYSAQTGLALEIDTRWFDAGGYRPLLLRASTAAAAGADREIELEVSFAEASGRGLTGEPGMVVRGRIVLPAGANEAETTLLCPGISDWRFAWWEARVDGKLDPRLSLPRGSAVAIGVNPQSVSLRKLNPQPASKALPFQSRDGRVKVFRRMSGPTLDDVVAPFQKDWLAYSGTDVIAINLSELKSLAGSSPTETAALRRWVLSGGTLWVERSGASDARLNTIDDLLGIGSWRFQATPSEREDEDSADTQTKEGVDQPGKVAEAAANKKEKPEKPSQSVRAVEGCPGWGHPLLGNDQDAETLSKQLKAGEAAKVVRQLLTKTKDTSGWYAQREVGFGRVLAFRRSALETPLALALGGAREATKQWAERGWSNRHGLAPTEPSPTFGNLLIPDVGVAPVNEFQVLITLFVLAIGPLNYWVLWRRQQLQLLVLTTPLCALIVTLGLFAYAAVADGFGVKARVRSLTLLDQTTGEAVTWGRVSHYAATAPEAPPRFPADTAIYPIRPVWESAISTAPASRKIDWRNGEQTLTSGWIPNRTTVQHLAVRCRETPAQLLVRSEGGAHEASNQLGVPLELLLVFDAQKKWLRATGIEAGSVAELDPVPREEALKDFRLMALANQPEFPVGAGKAIEQTLERLGSGRDLRRMQRNLSAASLTDNLLNDRIGTLSGLRGGRGIDVPPQTYLAVTRRSVETPLGWENVQEIGSFHVIVGRW